MNDEEYKAFLARRRGRNIALACVLVALTALFYALTLVRGPRI